VSPPGAADHIDLRDDALVAQVDAALLDAQRCLGPLLDHARGCPACCLGPFPITALDARRLRRGLARLREHDASRAAALERRAQADVAAFAPHFPGDPATGRLGDDETAEEVFATRFGGHPCPALDPASGRCELYALRPLTCRTFGPPVRVGAEDLPPCERCCPGAETATLEGCRARIDPEGHEAELLRALAEATDEDGETLVAFALADEAARR
jgi:Fe-S-cluster containining protein